MILLRLVNSTILGVIVYLVIDPLTSDIVLPVGAAVIVGVAWFGLEYAGLYWIDSGEAQNEFEVEEGRL